MRYAFIAEHRQQWPVRFQCRVLCVSASGFYAWQHRKLGKRAMRRAELTEKVCKIHTENRCCYGSPRVFEQLKSDGYPVARKTVASIMRQQKIQGKSPQKRKVCTTDSDHTKPVAANVLARDFTATAPNQKWLVDITYIPTDEGWLYLAAVLDCFSRRIVGWSAADHMRAELVSDALQMAIDTRPLLPGLAGAEGNLIHHSDRGSQYVSDAFQQMLDKHKIVCSMSRKAPGSCYDNAAMESFWGTLKTELDEPLHTRAEARLALFEYIEVFYNRQRLHSTLNYVSPVAYEQQHQAA